MENTLLKYARYNYWANSKIVSFLQIADEALLDSELQSSFPTLRKTLYHIWDAETVWINRLQGHSLTSWPSREFKGDFREAWERMLNNSKAFMDFLSSQDEKFADRELSYFAMDGKAYTSRVTDMVMHCMNHSTFHRGQLVTMLRSVGFSQLSSTDYISFCRVDNP